MLQFATSAWFNELNHRTVTAGDLEIAPALAELKLNLVLQQENRDKTEICLNGGQIEPGHQPDAAATMILPYDMARRILLRWDHTVGMAGMLGGKIKVEGDKFKLMAMQTTRLSPQHKQMLRELEEITE